MAAGRDVVIDLDRVDAVIFDTDGVVTATAKAHAAAWKRMFDEYLRDRSARDGSPFLAFDIDTDYRRYVDGKLRYEGVEGFLRSRGISLPTGVPSDAIDRETVCGLGNRKNRLYLAVIEGEGVEPYPSTVEFIKNLRRRDIRTAVISASRNCTEVLEAAGVLNLFDVKVDGVDSDGLGLESKPDPAIFLEAARRLGMEPGRVAVVEDALAGVEAGQRGGFALVIGVNRGEQHEELRAMGADLVVEDLGEIVLKNGEGLPPVASRRRPMSELPSALHHLEEIGRFMNGKSLAVFLDYDGTLTPIVDRPEDAKLSEGMRSAVRRLATLCTVAIVSGRDLDDVRTLVGIGGIAYAGSHGFDLVAPDGSAMGKETWLSVLPSLDRAQTELERSLTPILGARVERKKFAIAVHYRLVADENVAAVEKAVDEIAVKETDLRKAGGKKVFELRPDIDWHKGQALLYLLQAMALDREDVAPLFIGDDVTDEDAFLAIQGRGLGVIVRGEDDRETAAQYSLQDTAETERFLDGLAGLIALPA